MYQQRTAAYNNQTTFTVTGVNDAPVVGKYIMMGPESINYAQHFADANLQAIDLGKMTKAQIEQFNKLVREGYPYKKSGEHFQRVFPSFPGIEDKGSAYLHMAIDPDLRKHFNSLMQKSTVTDALNMPSGHDIRFAITEPSLRDLEPGVTGYSMGRMRPDIPASELKLSEHPTYSHDIPGHFMGQSRHPIPYELSFPDLVKSIRENPRQAPHEFGTLQYSGPTQTIDQQLIDELRMYEERMKELTGKAAGGPMTKAIAERLRALRSEFADKAAAVTAIQERNRKLPLEQLPEGSLSQEAIEAEIQRLRQQKPEGMADGGLSTQDLLYLQSQDDLSKLSPAAQREYITNMGGQELRQRMSGKYAGGGEITADDLILEERKL